MKNLKNFNGVNKSYFIVIITLLLILPLGVLGQSGAKESPKKTISSIDQLPKHTYKISGTITQLLNDDRAFSDFSQQVRQDIEKDLEEYDILDKKTLRDFNSARVTLDLLKGKHKEVLDGILRLREMEDKPAEKLMTGLSEEVITLTRQKTEATEGKQFQETYARILKDKIKKYPWKVIQDRIIESKGRMEIYNRNFLIGIVQSQMEPIAKKNGNISIGIALQVIRLRYFFQEILPLKEHTLKVYEELIKANRIEKPDIWKDREVDLSDKKNLSEVVIAIWDTGVDTSVFPGQLFTNPKEKIDNLDNDRNGYVDDVHGIAYTLRFDKTPELLYPLDKSKGKDSIQIELLKGYVDLTNAIDSPEATALKKKFSALKPQELNPVMESLMKQALYMHGTHVAGIAIKGNPYARILVARLTADYRQIAGPLTMELTHKSAQMLKDVIDYFKTNHVRVVNMSWDMSFKEIEKDLEANGVGKNPQERRAMARKMFDIQKKAFYEAIAGAPDIVFVNAAGNDDDDPKFTDCIPTAIDLPNVIVAGAVNQSGDETSFTSFGEAVDVYANGYNVVSYIPGGYTIAASGTSMSSPQVANLAAKLIALKPHLKAKEVAELIKKGADKSKDGRILLINPKHTVELLK